MAMTWLGIVTAVGALAIALFELILVVLPIGWAFAFARAEAKRRRNGSETPAWQLPPPDAAGRSAVILIHGTFARGAPWTLAASALSRALESEATIVRFDWSGANSMRSRRLASEGLRACVAALGARGFERIALVAHSHGGNIALKACESPATAARVQAIVCLATPFIAAWRPRARIIRQGVRLGIVLVLLPWMLLMPSVFGLPSYLAVVARVSVPGTVDTVALALLVTYLGVGAGLGWLLARRFADADRDPTLPEDLAGSICDPAAIAPLADRTLVLTSGGDEADGVLKIASALNRSLVAGSHWRPTTPGERRASTEHVESGLILDRLQHAMFAAITHLPGAIANLAFGVDGLSTGTSVFLSAWPKCTVRSVRPRARANRM